MSKPYHTALVTGASRGIGAAISRALVGEGLVVHALARNVEALQELAAELGPNLRPLACDVRDAAAVASALEGIEIDVLVNNAGAVASVKPLHEQSLEETANTIALNLTAPLHLLQTLLPGMINRRKGHVFNLSSTAAQGALANTAVYGATKAALAHATKALRFDLAGHNIRLTEIAPGRVETDFYLSAFEGDRARLSETMYTRQRGLHPQDVADTVVMALRMPARANVTQLTISPTDQALGGHVFPDAQHPDEADA
ncbi:SDR family oxidoreductase [Roseovarius aestuarii]|nr:SDR family oxidoreductase [Roseovarius aestuarii]